MKVIKNYTDLKSKDSVYRLNRTIDSESDLIQLIELLSKEHNLVFRGLNNAKYRNYSSSQRKWIWNDPVIQRLGFNPCNDSYHGLIRETIDKVKSDQWILDYFHQKDIPINDMLILALLQHYVVLSPLLDFTTDVHSALFFAQDGASPYCGTNNIDDYISIYAIDKNIDWMRASIQSINKSGAESANKMVLEYNGPYVPQLSEETESELINLTYEKYLDIKFFPVEGPGIGVTPITIPALGFSCQYFIDNPRLESQAGLFIMNNTVDKPLEDLIADYYKYTQFRPMYCWNINKKLIDKTINCDILQRKGVNHSTLYCSSSESKELESKMMALFN